MTSPFDLFLRPRSVALIGVTTRTGAEAFNILERMIAEGYTGRLYPVNPRGGELLGVPVYRSVSEIPETPDLAVISTPRTAVPTVVKECLGKGIKALIVITQGFADADEKGRQMQREILDALEGTGARLIGPNTIGVANFYEGRFSTSFIDFWCPKADTAVICQSGIFLVGAADFTGGLGLGIDIGNAADLHFAEVLEYMGRDPRVKVLALHMEGLKDGRRFMKAARRVSRLKPVLCLKTGRSEAGARAATTHTGSLAGEDRVYEAAFRQCGIIRLRDAEEMSYFTKTFLTYPFMRGRRLAVVTISGGAGIMAADAANAAGLDMASFDPQTYTRLANIFPEWMEVHNPLDIWPAAMTRGYREVAKIALEAVLSDPHVDAVLFITPAYQDLAETPHLDVTDIVNHLAASHPDKPLALWVIGSYRREFAAKAERENRVVVYPSPEKAASSLAALYRYHQEIKNSPSLPAPEFADAEEETIEALLGRAGEEASGILNEEALDILKACGIPVLPYRRASSPEEAVRAARELGYPVAVKISSPHITHKTDVGGVKLGLTDDRSVEEAFHHVVNAALACKPEAKVSGVIVQPYRPGGAEVLLGCRQDPVFGPVVVFGLGGIYAELFQDVSFGIAPLSREEALAMLKETKAYRLLQGFRGQPPANMEALLDCLLRLGWLADRWPQIKEMDINPLLVSATGVVAVDARMIVQR